MTMVEQRRQVVLGSSGHRTAQLVDWAARLLWPGDRVRVVHVDRPIPYAATDWQLPVDKTGLGRTVTRRHVSAVADQLRRKRPDLTVTEELASGDSTDLALAGPAVDADLILLGTPRWARNRNMLGRLLAEVDCPVILTGRGEPTGIDSVAAVLRGDPADDAVLRAAFKQAQRERCGLLVLKRLQPPLDGNLRYAETAEQKTLDNYLTGWQERYSHVAVAAELRFGESLPELMGHGAHAGLLVLAMPTQHLGQDDFEAALDEVIEHRTRPTMLIPEGETAPMITASTSTGAGNG